MNYRSNTIPIVPCVCVWKWRDEYYSTERESLSVRDIIFT